MSKSISKIKTGRLILLGVSVFLFFAFTRAPAEWGAWMLTRQPGLGLSGISGSLWKGQANVASLAVEGRTITLGKLQWDLQLSSLLKLSPCVKLMVTGQEQSFNGTVCSSGRIISLKDADLVLPASLIQSKIPVPIAGNFSVHFSEMQLQGNVLLKLAGNINWTGAQANNQVQWIPLGAFAAEFTDNGKNGIRAKIFDIDSEMDIEMQVELRAPNGGSANGQLDVPKAMVERYNLGDFLAFVGPQTSQENGKIRYQVQQEF